MKKSRVYELEYWHQTTKITMQKAFKNYNQACKYLFRKKYKMISVQFIGWQTGWV